MWIPVCPALDQNAVVEMRNGNRSGGIAAPVLIPNTPLRRSQPPAGPGSCECFTFYKSGEPSDVGRLPKKRSGIESQWHVAYSIKSVFRSFCQTPQNHPPVTVVLDSEAEMHLRTLHLDGTLLEFGSEEEEFFRSETDTEELKNMLLKCARRCTR